MLFNKLSSADRDSVVETLRVDSDVSFAKANSPTLSVYFRRQSFKCWLTSLSVG